MGLRIGSGPLWHLTDTLDRVAAHYANAKLVERGACWRMVSRNDGYRKGSPTGCPEPVCWTGLGMVGKKRMRLWSCEGHAEGLGDLRPVNPRST